MTSLIFVVFFIYGLAFLSMGISLALESSRSPSLAEGFILRPLAAFGLLHGIHEWLESYINQAEALGTIIPAWLGWMRLVLLFSSFTSLVLFAYRLMNYTSRGMDRHIIPYLGGYFFYGCAILLNVSIAYRGALVPWPNLLDGLSRYLLAIPASTMTAIALHSWSTKARSEKKITLPSALAYTGLGFGVYAITQIFVSPLAFFPASFLNESSFLDFFGFPIQIIRTLAAVWITYNLIRAINLTDMERKEELELAQQARLETLQKGDALQRELLRHTVHAQEEERARIARELHDETAQELTAFSLELATLRSMLKRNKSALAKVEHLQTLSARVSQGLYRLVRDLRPAQLDDLGLVAALRYLIGQYHSNLNIDVEFKVMGDVHRIDPLLETVLFRVAQEGLNNVARHSGTTCALTELAFHEDDVYLMVADQGQGFDANGRFSAPHGWGLAGMRERVESVNGVLCINSRPGQGTKVEVTIPIVKESKRT